MPPNEFGQSLLAKAELPAAGGNLLREAREQQSTIRGVVQDGTSSGGRRPYSSPMLQAPKGGSIASISPPDSRTRIAVNTEPRGS